MCKKRTNIHPEKLSKSFGPLLYLGCTKIHKWCPKNLKVAQTHVLKKHFSVFPGDGSVKPDFRLEVRLCEGSRAEDVFRWVDRERTHVERVSVAAAAGGGSPWLLLLLETTLVVARAAGGFVQTTALNLVGKRGVEVNQVAAF